MRARGERVCRSDELRDEGPERELRRVMPEGIIEERVHVQKPLEQNVGEGDEDVPERERQRVARE